ncbi:MAG: hypothetical protein UR60_C0022G0006 [Candidatus Moranbacteria bacterium GW2011_GWF2_34_56]|nr:MAG: hypothetical protein UR51_C0018G0007 [Candidatus Moranbacteria bacterium GW2011_GWF1_34_10]KKP64376.1 MAG: hypothetical protein UR60_C0022G0006 [Candidatus Moranbacteria bacterium GW2011_GWF2_34_56]HBI17508.1 hypothetical protein [Candidatus Moranbacteria bacterium]
MKIFLLEKDGDNWRKYERDLLSKDHAYNFVGWMNAGIFLVAPTEISGRSFCHQNAVDCAAERWIEAEDKLGKPDVMGAIAVNFNEHEDYNRICSWTSQSYGATDKEFRQPIREILELKDVVYKN